MPKIEKIVTLNQKDSYVLGHLFIKNAFSKKSAISLAKSYHFSAEKMVKCKTIQKYEGKYWMKRYL